MNCVHILRGKLGLGAVVLTLSMLLSSGASARDPDALLKQVDQALHRYQTLDFRYVIKTRKPGGEARRMKVHMRMKDGKQLTVVREPADMKGMKVLIKSATQMYVFMPQLGKIRRVASHVGEQSFMGTAFSAADMNLTRYSGLYQATILRESSNKYTLRLDARANAKAPYDKIIMKVDKARLLPTDMKYFAGGKHIKSESRRNYICVRSVCQAKKMRMVHHGEGDLSSTLTLTRHKIDTPLGDHLFTKRSLLR